MEADDVLADQVQPLVGTGPETLVVLALVRETEGGDVVAEGVDPHVENVVGFLGNRNPPLHASSAHREVLETLLDDPEDLVLPRLGTDEESIGGDPLLQPLLVGRQPEEEVLLLGPLARQLVVGANVVRRQQLVLVLEALAPRAVPPRVRPLIDRVLPVRGLRRPQARPELQDASPVLLLGGADEAVVPDVEPIPEGTEFRRDLVAVLLLGDPPLAGDALDVLPVLVGAGQEEHVVAREAPGPGQGVGGDRGVGVPHVGDAVHVVDGGCDQVASFVAHCCFPARSRQAASASARTCLTGTFLSSAARRQSSNSGQALYTVSPRRPILTRIGP